MTEFESEALVELRKIVAAGPGGGGSGGDASAAKQDTGNASLASLDTKTPSLGQKTAAGSQSVVLSSDGPFATNFGSTTDTAATTDTGTFSFLAFVKRLLQGITSIVTSTGLSSTAANQATELTDLGGVTETAPATDTASSGLNGRLQRIAQRLTSLIGLTPATQPSQNSGVVDAGTARVVLASDGPTVTALGTTTQTKATDGTTTAWSIIQLLKGIFDKLLGSLAVTATLGTETTKVIGTVNLTDISAAEYETVAASQTAQALGATGATGDYISGVLVVPATLNPGNVLLLDNATSITIFTGGTASVSNLVPFFIPLGMKSVSGAWKLTTGASVSCIGIGNFS